MRRRRKTYLVEYSLQVRQIEDLLYAVPIDRWAGFFSSPGAWPMLKSAIIRLDVRTVRALLLPYIRR